MNKYINAEELRSYICDLLVNRLFLIPRGKYNKGYNDGELEILERMIHYLDAMKGKQIDDN